MKIEQNQWYQATYTHSIKHKKWWEFWKSDECTVSFYMKPVGLKKKKEKHSDSLTKKEI